MNRKNTILIAVSLNSCLLFMLFLAAHTSPSGEASSPSEMGSYPSFVPVDNQSPMLDAQPEGRGLDTPPSPLGAVPEVVHQLPALASQELPLPEAPIAAVPEPVVISPPNPMGREVTVKKGDSLDKIARAHKTTVDELIKLNRLPSSFLKVGQVLKLPAEKAVAAAPSLNAAKGDSSPEYYVVRPGDNPWKVAMKHHIKVEDLLRLNNLTPEKARKLKAGDRLRVK